MTADKPWLVAPCKRRRCPGCGPGLWRPYQQAKYMAGLDGVDGRLVKVCTLTAPGSEQLPDESSVRRWNLDAPARWNHFLVLLRRAFPHVRIEAWGVWEYQDRRALHRHFLLRGLRFIPMELFRRLAVQAGFGSRVQLEAVRTSRGGVRALLGYFTGYLLKASSEWDRRAYVISSSQGWAPTWRRRRRREGPPRWVFASLAEWWWSVGRDEFFGAAGVEASEHRELRYWADAWPFVAEGG